MSETDTTLLTIAALLVGFLIARHYYLRSPTKESVDELHTKFDDQSEELREIKVVEPRDRSSRKILTEPELAASTPVSLRLAEAEYFLSQFRAHCGPPRDSYFLMICYLDAFLFSLVSVEDIISRKRKKLNECLVFKFLKAARNVTTHQLVLAAPSRQGEHTRPFSRWVFGGTRVVLKAEGQYC